MAIFVEMDERVGIFAQMEEEDAGPAILINKFSESHEESDQFLKGWATVAKSSQDSFRHNYTKELVKVAHSLTMPFGSMQLTSRRQSALLWTHRTKCLHTRLVHCHDRYTPAGKKLESIYKRLRIRLDLKLTENDDYGR